MPPKNARRKEDSTVPSLPSINPALNAAQIKFDKWVQRVLELTRAKSDAIRQKSALVLTLRGSESKLKAVNAEAETVAQQALRPPPPPPPQSNTPIQNGKGRKSGSNSKLLAEVQVDAWKPPEATEAKRLQRVADALMAAYLTKRGGPDRPPEVEKTKKVSYRRKPAPNEGPPANLTSAMDAQQLQSSSLNVALAAGAASVPSAAPLPAPAPDGGVSPRGKNAKGEKSKDKEVAAATNVPQAPTQMVSMSLAAGSTVVMADPIPEPTNKGIRTPRGGKGKDKPPKAAGSKDASITQPIPSQQDTPPPGGLNPDGRTSSFRVVDPTSASPIADGMERPKGATIAQWDKLLQLRQDRLIFEDEVTEARAQALAARGRVEQIKEMEAISRYSLGAAQKELEALTGSSVPSIPGVTTQLPAPPAQAPSTPRVTIAVASAAASPDASPIRAGGK